MATSINDLLTTLDQSDHDVDEAYTDEQSQMLNENTTGDEEELQEEIDHIFNMIKSFPLGILSMMTAEEMFDKEIDKKNEHLALSKVIDKTGILQCELIERLHEQFDRSSLKYPEILILQVFKRKGGFASKQDEHFKAYKYAIAICPKEYQIIRLNRQSMIITPQQTSPIISLEEVSPLIPKNNTKVPLNNGKSTLKSREYCSIVIWGLWKTDPHKPKDEVDAKQELDTKQELDAKDEVDTKDEVDAKQE